MYGGVVLGAGTTAAAAIVLPNTGNSRLMAIVATVTLIIGVVTLVSTAARLIAKKAI